MKRILSLFLILSLAIGAVAQKTTSYTVNASTLNVRQAASSNAKVIGKVTKDQLVQVINIKDGWAYIYYGASTGYVSAQYLVKKGSSSASSTTQKSNSTSSSSSNKSSSNSSSSNKSSSNSSSSKTSQSSSNSFPYTDGAGARYGGYVDAGVMFTEGAGGFQVSTVHGCQIRDFIFAGAGLGLHTAFGPGAAFVAIPIYADARGTLRINKYVAPFLDFGIGGYYGWAVAIGYPEYSASGGGFYTHVMPGVNFLEHFSVSIGYERIGFNCGSIRFSYNW